MARQDGIPRDGVPVRFRTCGGPRRERINRRNRTLPKTTQVVYIQGVREKTGGWEVLKHRGRHPLTETNTGVRFAGSLLERAGIRGRPGETGRLACGLAGRAMGSRGVLTTRDWVGVSDE